MVSLVFVNVCLKFLEGISRGYLWHIFVDVFVDVFIDFLVEGFLCLRDLGILVEGLREDFLFLERLELIL